MKPITITKWIRSYIKITEELMEQLLSYVENAIPDEDGEEIDAHYEVIYPLEHRRRKRSEEKAARLLDAEHSLYG